MTSNARAGSAALRLIALLGALPLLAFGGPILIPIALAGLFFLLLEPTVRRAELRGIPRALAAPALILVASAGIGLAALGVGNELARLAPELPTYAQRLKDRLRPLAGRAAALERSTNRLLAAPRMPADVQKVHVVGNPFQEWVAALWRRMSSALAALMQLLMVPVLATFLLLEKEHLERRLAPLLGAQPAARRACEEASAMVRAYFVSNLVVATAFAAVFWLLYRALGLEQALALAAFAGLANLVPVFGAPLGALPAIGQALAQGASLGPVATILGVSVALHFAMANIVIPRFVGRRIDVNATAATVGLLFWGWIWGMPGLLMAVPLMALARIALGAHPRTEAWANLLAESPRAPAWSALWFPRNPDLIPERSETMNRLERPNAEPASRGRRIGLLASALAILVSAAAATGSPARADEDGQGLRLALGGIAGLTGAREGSSNPSQATGLSSSRKLGWGLGGLIEAPFGPSLGLETGALYVERRFDLQGNGFELTRTVPTVFVPVELRLWLGDALSVAGGAFGALRTGDQRDEIRSGGSTLGGVRSAGRESNELGMTLAGTLNLASVGKTGLFLEGRYNRGFTNSSKDGAYEERIDDLLLMAGIRLDFGR